MSFPPAETRRRVERLLRRYPKDWRSRYGDEFAELLVADMLERPWSWRRNADVAVSALVARGASAGLGGRPLEPCDQVRRSLATLGCAIGIFLVFGIAMWAQLTIGWQWSKPDTSATSAAMILMSGAVLVFLALAVVGAVPIAWTVVRRGARGQAKGLRVPSLLFVVGIGILVLGGHHFGGGWPGTGGHPWAQRGLVPGRIAAFAWASTLFVSSYWAHPRALLAFPNREIAWMILSPVAVISVVVGAAKTIRRLDLSPRILRYEAGLARMTAVAMIVFLVGCCAWILYGGPGPRNLFHVGAIDVAGLLIMAIALAVAGRAAHQAGRARLAFSPH
jgi:hypothetical protein